MSSKTLFILDSYVLINCKYDDFLILVQINVTLFNSEQLLK